MTTARCSSCPAPLAENKRRKGTMCRSCAARARVRSEEHRAKAAAAMRRRWRDPAQAEKLAKSAKAGLHRRLREDPAFAARRLEQSRANGRKTAHLLNAGPNTAIRRKAARSYSETKLGWCPLEYRDEYRHLRTNHKYSAGDARQIIEQEIAKDAARYAATGQLQRAPR